MEPRKVYVTGKDRISIVCPYCGNLHEGALKQGRSGSKVLRLRCSCGRHFPIILENRRHYRKPARLKGTIRINEQGTASPVLIKDLSLGGVCFITDDSRLLNRDRQLIIDFTLDDAHHSTVRKRAVTRRKEGNLVGCEFTSHQHYYDKALACYMMP